MREKHEGVNWAFHSSYNGPGTEAAIRPHSFFPFPSKETAFAFLAARNSLIFSNLYSQIRHFVASHD
jgi:hypothetical protein